MYSVFSVIFNVVSVLPVEKKVCCRGGGGGEGGDINGIFILIYMTGIYMYMPYSINMLYSQTGKISSTIFFTSPALKTLF